MESHKCPSLNNCFWGRIYGFVGVFVFWVGHLYFFGGMLFESIKLWKLLWRAVGDPVIYNIGVFENLPKHKGIMEKVLRYMGLRGALFRDSGGPAPGDSLETLFQLFQGSGPEGPGSPVRSGADPKPPNPEGLAIEKIQSRPIAWNFESIRLKVSIQDWKFKSRLKVSISLENFNPYLDNSPQLEPYFQSRLKFSITIEKFNLRLVAWKFRFRSEILNFFNLWALWEKFWEFRNAKFEKRPEKSPKNLKPCFIGRQRDGFVKGWVLASVPSFRFSFLGNIWTYPRSGFRSGGTSECTLVPVFFPGEHLPKPPFWKPPFCQPSTVQLPKSFSPAQFDT